ncbi:MAG TPA: hypothetical protein PLS70_04490 [Acidobacteriota bacterium]|nr:hypothetical protein [Acidobacteriota bacterium]
MNIESLTRIRTIITTDLLIRLRRTSTIFLFLVLCVAAYQFIPDPATGNALGQFDNHRALYNSAFLAVGTGMLCAFLLGFFGFYLTSNTIGRDIQTRTGFVIASTAVHNWEYLIGKFLGNCAFLGTIISGFAASAMVMQLIRGEAPVEPLVFVTHYVFILLPMVVFVSALAITFESIPLLSGKLGSGVYFLVWLFTITIPTIGMAVSRSIEKPHFTAYFDVYSMAMVIRQLQFVFQTESVSIGAAEFDPTLAPVVFPGFSFQAGFVLPWLSSTLLPLVLLGVVSLIFHRFNPAKLKASTQKSKNSWLVKINELVKPLTGRMVGLLERLQSLTHGPTLANSILTEFFLTLRLNPMSLLFMVGLGVASLVNPVSKLQAGVLPLLCAVVILLIADVSTRDRRSGTLGLFLATPHNREQFVAVKFASTLLLVLCFTVIPMVKLVFAAPSAALSLAIGSVWLAASTTCLGILTENPKTFTCLFFFVWYLAINSGNKMPALDFAGWYGVATPAIQATYAGIAFGMLVLAFFGRKWKEQT